MMLRLGDYVDGNWFFIAECESCGRMSQLEPVEVLDFCPSAHRESSLGEIEEHLRCWHCRRRQGRLEAVPRLPKQAFVADLI